MTDLASSVCRRPWCGKPFAEHSVYHDAPPDPAPPEGIFDFVTAGVFCPPPKASQPETVASDAENDAYVNVTVVIMTGLLQRIRAGWLPHAVGPERSSWYWGRPRPGPGDGFMLWSRGMVPSMSVVESMTDDEVRVWTEALHSYAPEKPQWCGPDDCPVTICGGPHASHHCPSSDGDLITIRADSTCPFCGWTKEKT